MGNKYTFKTFEKWCIENNRYDILSLWDYDLNDTLPSEIPAGTKKKYYFKCANGIHDSEMRRVSNITAKPDHVLICKQCEYNNPKDLTGQKFGELTVIELDKEKTNNKNNIQYWICECSCGRKVSCNEYKLFDGKKLTCKGSKGHLKPKAEVQKIKDLRKSPDYYQYRKAVFAKDNAKCIITGKREKEMEVHHIYPFASYPHHRFDVNCGICISKKYHSANVPGSFHSEYGKIDNTPEQFEEYVNKKRKEIGIKEHFDIYEYMNDIYSDNLEIDDTMLN